MNYKKDNTNIDNKFNYCLVSYSSSYDGSNQNNFILAKKDDVINNDLNGYGVLWARSINKAIEEVSKLTINDKKDNVLFKGSEIDNIPYYKDIKDINNNYKYTFYKNLIIK